MAKYNLCITGANGQVAKELQILLQSSREFTYQAFNKSELDISDQTSVEKLLLDHRFDALINCAAYTAVDLAEKEIENAKRINCLGPEILAKMTKLAGIPLLHYSSDYVYDNGLTRPLQETDPCRPQNVYASTKLMGEQAVRTNNPKSVIVRTSWVYSVFGQNFVKTILHHAQQKPELKVVNDQIGAPTWAYDLAEISLIILSKLLSKNSVLSDYGIFNYSSKGQISWFDFASEIVSQESIPCFILPITSAEYPRPAKRPNYSVLDNSKIMQQFGILPPEWKASLRLCLSALKAGQI